MQKNDKIGKLGRSLKRRIVSMFGRNSDRFLKKATGIIHVGANTGQEINLYAQYGLPVVWIEPIPDIFLKSCKLIWSVSQNKKQLKSGN